MINSELHPEFFHDLRAGVSDTISCRVAIACNRGWIKIGTIACTMDGSSFSPILLDAPRIKESIDVEDNKFKISDVNLNISNIKQRNKICVGGERDWYYTFSPNIAPGMQHPIGHTDKPSPTYYDRFTDVLERDSLMGAKTLVFFDTPNSISRGGGTWVDIVQESEGMGSDELWDFYRQSPQTPWFYRGPMVYRGSINNITHDDTKVNITLEDLTSENFHKDIPNHTVNNDNGDKSIKFPITYGHVDVAPTKKVNSKTFQADSEPYKVVIDTDDEDYDEVPHSSDTHYREHPAWGVVDGWKEHIGLSPLMLIYDDTPIYIPIKVLKRIEDSMPNDEFFFLDNSITDYMIENAQQWAVSDEVPGRIALNSTIHTSNGFLQAFGIMKPSDLQFHIRFTNYSNGSDNFRSFWRDNVESQDRHTEKFYEKMTDGKYGAYNRTIENINGYDPGKGSEYWSSATGSSWDNYANGSFTHFNLLRFKICTDIFDYNHHLMQFSINKFKFPPMSKNEGEPMHWYYITSNFNEDYNYGYWNFFNGIDFTDSHHEAGYEADHTMPSNPFIVTLETPFSYFETWNAVHTSPSISDKKFKEIFDFVTFRDSSYYSGNQTELLTGNEISITNDEQNFRINDEVHPVCPYVQLSNRHDYYDGGQSAGINLIFGLAGLGQHTSDGDGPAFSCHLTGGFWQQVDLCLLADIPDYGQYDVYINSGGRYDSDGVSIENPIAIIRDLIEREISDNVDFDEDSYNAALDYYSSWQIGFSLTEVMSSKEVIEEIAKNTLCYPHFKNNGKFTFPTLAKTSYSVSDWGLATQVKAKDVISYKFKKTDRSQVPSRIDIFANKNYYKDEYDFAYTNWHITKLDEGLLSYNGYQYHDDNILEIESDYIRKLGTLNSFAVEQKNFRKIQKNIVEIRVPLKYLDIEVGDIIKFDQLLDGVMAYGNEYTKVNQLALNEEADDAVWTYPLFFITSTQKSLKDIRITAMQLHQQKELYGGELEDREEWDEAGLAYKWGDWTPPDVPSVDWENYPLIPRWTQGSEWSFVFRPGKNLSLIMYDLLPLDPWGVDNPLQYVLQGIQDGNFEGWELAENLFNHPSRWGISSWDELIPNDWSEFPNTSFRRDYKAIRIEFTHPNMGAGAHSLTPSQASLNWITCYLSWGNISGSSDPDEMEFGWMWEDIPNELGGGEGAGNFYNLPASGSTSTYMNDRPQDYPYYPGLDYGLDPDFGYFSNDSICRFFYGTQLATAINAGGVDVDYLTYTKPETSSLVGPSQPAKGDINQDFTISIMDFSKMNNMLYDYSADPHYGPVGQEWSFVDMDDNNWFNVYDSVALLEIITGQEFEGGDFG